MKKFPYFCSNKYSFEMKKLLLLMLAMLPCFVMAEKKVNTKNYLAGKVPVVNGMVTFEKTIQAQGKTKAQIFDALTAYTNTLIEQSEHKDLSRITESNVSEGTLAASMEEYLYFKRRAWESDFTHFLYQLIFEVADGQFKATIRRISYVYDEDRNAANALYKAEDWITDEAALKDAKTLRKAEGKFRIKTIDRVNEIFGGAEQAVNGR